VAFTDDGFLRTGDLRYATEDGGFVFLARLGDALRLGGFLVSPAEVEEVLQSHPGEHRLFVCILIEFLQRNYAHAAAWSSGNA
jgi:acyl-CoA synthetase (AMP-forming)/AMP-acid ligase II